MDIIEATKDNVHIATKFALMLWPENAYQEIYNEFVHMIDSKNCAVFLASINNEFIGFAQCQLRFDYVEGTSSSPVGYLEGIYVMKDYRRMGVGEKLVSVCEQWAKKKGCSEFGSDAELENFNSYQFHINIGFKEENRIICFTKNIK